MKFSTFILISALVLAFWFLMSAVWAWIFMFLWNFALVPTFGAPTLSFWISYALTLLTSMVLGGIRVKVK